jgi:hypothetical protein
MDPNAPISTPGPVPQTDSVSKAQNSSTNRQAIMAVAGLGCLLVVVVSFAYYFLFIGPYSAPSDQIAVLTGNYESKTQPSRAPTPTPTVNPWLVIKQVYANPFEEETQYENPFEDADNPFAELE